MLTLGRLQIFVLGLVVFFVATLTLDLYGCSKPPCEVTNTGIKLINLMIFIAIPLVIAGIYRKNRMYSKWLCDEEIQQWQQRQHGLKILKKRLAKGEITQQEYDDLKKQFEQPSKPES